MRPCSFRKGLRANMALSEIGFVDLNSEISFEKYWDCKLRRTSTKAEFISDMDNGPDNLLSLFLELDKKRETYATVCSNLLKEENLWNNLFQNSSLT
ncbi:hypothetical protein JTB14_024592 [Gonioctena quinquepunctata]|nr:hypothetical protein JTB14_024592 [Gonioctena quinquepunctata]